MKRDEISIREVLALLLGAALMFFAMAAGQWLDADDRKHEAEKLRVRAVQSGFEEGLDRLRCVGGIRYDLATGMAVDIEEELLAKRSNHAN